MSKWIVSVPYFPDLKMYNNFECDSELEAIELAKQFKEAEVKEVAV